MSTRICASCSGICTCAACYRKRTPSESSSAQNGIDTVLEPRAAKFVKRSEHHKYGSMPASVHSVGPQPSSGKGRRGQGNNLPPRMPSGRQEDNPSLGQTQQGYPVAHMDQKIRQYMQLASYHMNAFQLYQFGAKPEAVLVTLNSVQSAIHQVQMLYMAKVNTMLDHQDAEQLKSNAAALHPTSSPSHLQPFPTVAGQNMMNMSPVGHVSTSSSGGRSGSAASLTRTMAPSVPLAKEDVTASLQRHDFFHSNNSADGDKQPDARWSPPGQSYDRNTMNDKLLNLRFKDPVQQSPINMPVRLGRKSNIGSMSVSSTTSNPVSQNQTPALDGFSGSQMRFLPNGGQGASPQLLNYMFTGSGNSETTPNMPDFSYFSPSYLPTTLNGGSTNSTPQMPTSNINPAPTPTVPTQTSQ
jgi:hypothetical protein